MHNTPIPGTSPHPPLSEERIKAAQEIHGDAVDHYLKQLRLADPVADELVAHFETLPKRTGFRLLMQAIDKGIESVDSPPEAMVALFQHVDDVPLWVDWERMNIASQKMINSGLLTGMSFALFALPHSYLATANVPLTFTSELINSTAHRYSNTSRFVIETFMPGGLQRHADGFRLAIIVRIMHAQVRRDILQSGEWDDQLGLPLNQAHLAMNTIFFSFFVMRGLEGLGVNFSREEAESVLLTWRYVAHLFGIPPEFTCTTEEEAERLLAIAFSLEFDPDESSALLSHAMMKAGPEYMKIKDERIGRFFIKILYPLSRRLLGDELADQLNYPKEKRTAVCMLFITMVRFFDRFPRLMPRQLRSYLGIQFWLEKSNYSSSAALHQSHAKGGVERSE